MDKSDHFRQRVAIVVSAAIVIVLLASGPASMIATIQTGRPIGFPEDWKTAILSLASVALTFLFTGRLASPTSAGGLQPGVNVPLADPGTNKVTVEQTPTDPAAK